tara:strand:+ start:41865 stop:42089 length:225 start_codon:yes stop_codon:yes gene_type:complete
MSSLIDNIFRDRKYKLEINARGGRYEGDIRHNTYGYALTVSGVKLTSHKAYKRYSGAQIAARKLINKLENTNKE